MLTMPSSDACSAPSLAPEDVQRPGKFGLTPCVRKGLGLEVCGALGPTGMGLLGGSPAGSRVVCSRTSFWMSSRNEGFRDRLRICELSRLCTKNFGHMRLLGYLKRLPGGVVDRI